MAADPDGGVGALDGFGLKDDVGELDVLAVKGGVVGGPEFDEGLEVFVGYGAALLEGGGVEEVEFLLHPADAGAYD